MVKWTKIVLCYTKTIIFLVKGLKVVAKSYLNWNFFMMTSIVVLNTQMQNIKLRSSILSIKSDAQKQMVESDFGCRFHDPNYFEVINFFLFLEFIIYLRASPHNFVKNHQFNVILTYFKQILDSHLFNITYLHATCNIF